MKFRYIGPHDEVEIPALAAVVKHCATVEASGPLGESLQAQSDVWEHIPDPKRSRAAKKAAETRAANADDAGQES